MDKKPERLDAQEVVCYAPHATAEFRIMIRHFNRQRISLAAETLERWNKEQRYIRGFTIGISPK